MNPEPMVFWTALLANILTFESLRSACLVLFIGCLVALLTFLIVAAVGATMKGRMEDNE